MPVQVDHENAFGRFRIAYIDHQLAEDFFRCKLMMAAIAVGGDEEAGFLLYNIIGV